MLLMALVLTTCVLSQSAWLNRKCRERQYPQKCPSGMVDITWGHYSQLDSPRKGSKCPGPPRSKLQLFAGRFPSRRCACVSMSDCQAGNHYSFAANSELEAEDGME